MIAALLIAAASLSPAAETEKLLRSCDLKEPAAIIRCYADKEAEIDYQLNALFSWEREYSAPYSDQYSAAQEAWRSWRQAQCSAEVAEESQYGAWGAKTGYSECAIKLALERMQELRKEKRNAELYERMTKAKPR